MNDSESQAGRPLLGVWTGTGLVIANMVGAGVFISTGFMAQQLTPTLILLAWLVGALVALSGALSYAAVSAVIPRSGGEYIYLSRLLHPLLGYLSGWASLLIGFSAPIAIDAIAASEFLKTILSFIPTKATAVVIVIALTTAHAKELNLSFGMQNCLVALKAALLGGFTLLGLLGGSNRWPSWEPPRQSTPTALRAFMNSLFYIAFAFSGWNAATYAAGEFAAPKRDVPRALTIGCLSVGALYLAINWVFVANIDQQSARVVFQYESTRITLGHLVAQEIIGPVGAKVMSGLMVLAFVSAISAMTLVGPRVYAAMAEDGYLPGFMAMRGAKPPSWSIVLQGAISLVLLLSSRLQKIMQNVGAILTVFSSLTALSLFKLFFFDTEHPRPSTARIAIAGLYVLFSFWMLYFGFEDSPTLLLWLAAVVGVAAIAYRLSRRYRTTNRE